MPARRKLQPPAPAPIAGPGNFQAAAHAMGLRIVTYQDRAIMCEDGTSRWIPRDVIGKDGRTLILWRAKGDQANAYASDGWEPWHDDMFGGHYDRFENALAWVQRAMDVRAGKASDFRGV